jgi:hypothetical protein
MGKSLLSSPTSRLPVSSSSSSPAFSTALSTQSSLAQTPQQKNAPWRQALFKFERFRVIHGHSVDSLFNFLNPRGTRSLPIREFADNLSQFCHEIHFSGATYIKYTYMNK